MAKASEASSAPKHSSKTSMEKVKHGRKIWAPTKAKRGLSETLVQKMQRTAARLFAPPKPSTSGMAPTTKDRESDAAAQ